MASASRSSYSPCPLGSTDPAALGRYELICRLASGGMAMVYLGRARGAAGFERLFAIKRCHPHLLADTQFATMFLDEARLAATIRHPNVVATLDLGTADDLFIAMEYIEGGTLGQLLDAAAASPSRGLPVEIVLRIALDALQGLHAAHEACAVDGRLLEIVHRDISPHNLLVGIDGLTRVTDFGIARAASRLQETTGRAIKGKLGYMSPEQLNRHAVDRRTDVFSVGIVLWEALTGRHLFIGDSPAAVAHAVSSAPIPKPSLVLPRLRGALDNALLRALERDADKRYPTALAFAEAVEQTGLPVANQRAVGTLVEQLLRRDLDLVHAAAAGGRIARSAGASAARAEAPPAGALAAIDLAAIDLAATDLAATDLAATDLAATDLAATDLAATDLAAGAAAADARGQDERAASTLVDWTYGESLARPPDVFARTAISRRRLARWIAGLLVLAASAVTASYLLCSLHREPNSRSGEQALPTHAARPSPRPAPVQTERLDARTADHAVQTERLDARTADHAVQTERLDARTADRAVQTERPDAGAADQRLAAPATKSHGTRRRRPARRTRPESGTKRNPTTQETYRPDHI